MLYLEFLSMLLPMAVASMTLLPINTGNNHNTDVFTHLSSMSYAENNSAYHLTKGHEVPYKRGESAFTSNEFSIGTRYKNFALSYIYRYDWFLRFTEDTMEYYGTTVNGTQATEGKNYNIDLKVNHLLSEGLRLAYIHELSNANLYVAASYLKAREMMEGELSGYISRTGDCDTSSDCYSGDLSLDYTYSEDVLLDRVADMPTSKYGYSFDIGADWQINDDWYSSVYIQDLFSKIVWEEAPYTTASATTSRTVVVDGYYKVKPAVRGYEGNENYRQTLPTKYNALLGHQFNPAHSAYLQGYYCYGSLVAHLGYQYFSGNSAYRLKLYPLQEAVGIEYKHSFFNFAYTSKLFDFEESELAELKIGVTIPIQF